VTNLREEDVYDVDERAYVRKAEVDEDLKQTRLQELKEQLAASESEEAAELRDEIEALEARIEDLTGFDSAKEFYADSQADR
jgi:polyhydroxyalkanoate synthesis regulator phasin